MIPFGSASTTQYSLCPAGHTRLGAFPFSRLDIQLSDLSRYFILYQWILANKINGLYGGPGKWECALPVLYERVDAPNILSYFVTSLSFMKYRILKT